MGYTRLSVRKWGCLLCNPPEEQKEGSEGNPLRQQPSTWAALVALSLTALLFLYRTPFIDDAYITFRYSQRLSELGSLSWNTGAAPVMGTTTALWTLLISGLHTLGLSVEGAALALTTVLVFILLYSLLVVTERVFRTYNITWGRIAAASLIAIIALHVPVRVSLFSGMETTLYCLLVLRCIVALSSAPALSGLYAGLATLSRPDGILLLLVGLIFSRGNRQRIALPFLVTTTPWFIYSFITFGELLPGSVAAKRILYPSPWLTNFLMFFEAHSQDLLQRILFYSAGAGLFAGFLIPRLRPLVLWLMLYAGGIVVSGVKPIFFWYFAPSWLFGLFVGGVSGICFLIKRRNLPPRVLNTALVVIASVVCVDSLQQDLVHRSSFLRESTYREIVSSRRDKVAPADTILVGETGIIGFGFSNNVVIDSAGLVSLEVRPTLQALRVNAAPELRNRELATLPGWSRKLIEQFSPTWIIAARARFDLFNLEEDPWFTARYERTGLYIEHHLGGIGVYRRR